MAVENVETRETSWRRLLPWTELFRGFQVALDLSMDDLRNAARKAGMALPMGPAPGGAAAAGGAAPLASGRRSPPGLLP